jgi:hypothetical protein
VSGFSRTVSALLKAEKNNYEITVRLKADTTYERCGWSGTSGVVGARAFEASDGRPATIIRECCP